MNLVQLIVLCLLQICFMFYDDDNLPQEVLQTNHDNIYSSTFYIFFSEKTIYKSAYNITIKILNLLWDGFAYLVYVLISSAQKCLI